MVPSGRRELNNQQNNLGLTKEIESEIHYTYRNHLFKCKNLVEYKQHRNKVTSMLCTSKKKYFQQFVTSSQNSKLIWKAVNKLTNKSNSKEPTTNNRYFRKEIELSFF